MSILQAISRHIARVETVAASLSCLALMLMMTVVIIDVAGRYIFNSPLEWAYDVISLYLMVSVFFFALSDTLHNHGHVSIDVALRYMPLWLRHAGEALGYAFATFIFAIVTVQAWVRLSESFTLNEVLEAAYQWPTWIAFVPLLLGSALLTVRLLYRFVGHAASIMSKAPVVECPPPPEME